MLQSPKPDTPDSGIMSMILKYDDTTSTRSEDASKDHDNSIMAMVLDYEGDRTN